MGDPGRVRDKDPMRAERPSGTGKTGDHHGAACCARPPSRSESRAHPYHESKFGGVGFRQARRNQEDEQQGHNEGAAVALFQARGEREGQEHQIGKPAIVLGKTNLSALHSMQNGTAESEFATEGKRATAGGNW